MRMRLQAVTQNHALQSDCAVPQRESLLKSDHWSSLHITAIHCRAHKWSCERSAALQGFAQRCTQWKRIDTSKTLGLTTLVLGFCVCVMALISSEASKTHFSHSCLYQMSSSSLDAYCTTLCHLHVLPVGAVVPC